MPVEQNSNKQDNTANPGGLTRTILIFFLWLMLLNVYFSRTVQNQEIPYSQFIDQVTAGQVATAKIGSDRILYQLKTGEKRDFVTSPVPLDLELPKILRDHHVEFSALPPSSFGWLANVLGWIVPPLIFLGFWGWLMSRSPGGQAALTIGKSNARIYSEGSTGVTFEDVAGVDEAKAELREIVDFLRNKGKYTLLGAKIPKGVLLVGPPGTGKTLLAKAIAGEAGVPFFSISGSEFIELFVGIGASRVRDLFEQAKQQAPCIVFIDELDALGKSRGGAGPLLGANDEREQTLNQLLAEMDGFEPNTGVILLAATNRPEVLDPALLRPGRFDRQVVIDRPDKSGRKAILEVHAKSVKLASDVNFEKLAARTPGFAGADLANLVNEAALLAARRDSLAVTMDDFNEAIERLLTGLEKRSRVLNDLEKKTVAYHEAGHAIVGALMPGAGAVEKISIVPRGVGALGYTLQLPEEDRFLTIEDEIRGRLCTLLAGRSAEEIVLGKVSTGASDDLQKATELAERFVTLYGMSKQLGPIALEKVQQEFLEGLTVTRRSLSPKLAEAIDCEIQELIEGAHAIARSILSYNRDLLEKIALRLLETEIIDGEQLKTYLQPVKAPPEMADWLQRGELPSLNGAKPNAFTQASATDSVPISHHRN